MFSNIKNIIIFVVIGGILVFVYIYFFQGNPEEDNLIFSDPLVSGETGATDGASISVGRDFISLLLNIKSITLNDSIFTDPAFITLRDSSIILIQDGTEGRPNPFAPIGSEVTAPSAPTASFPAPGPLGGGVGGGVN
ncbi:hypothetical protein A3C67_00855 [Candidatus Nomurabacteria bacterium RIFCSPHIGHO2_02_FULL_42_19]|uniref:Uncharacterized protein n=1 Tax=Candidatus Nomurabacteria bacterium RIFCSPHIGHO2_02_FULL_42_19 TaxID=1801756 RepID=A0A1F6W131_9BACT|nr:MAG: hypothetical protein A3C67_00855 [Candidatus Nomurabacteria bacterium RIFCSPHIGHO2_02_FULL_42_19]